MRRLPSLASIEAFIQVARLGSIKAAAEELSLSSPALSRRIQNLERFFGHPLFERRHQSIHLNADGERLLAEIGPPLDSLSLAIERAIGGADLMRLRLGVAPLFASQRLMPRLAELRALHPQFHIDIDTAPHALLRLDDGIDAAIVIAPEVDASLYSRHVGSEWVIPIGSRRLLEGPDPLHDPERLRSTTVLLHRDMPDTFEHWREGAGRPHLQPAAIDYFDSGQLILEAAAEGLGVAFMLESHLEGAHDERLVELFGQRVQSPHSYFFACRRAALGRRPVRIFHDWLFGGIEARVAA